MTSRLARYEFSERLADLLGESRRDLRFRVTLLVSSGLVAAGPRGRGSPLATPEYAAQLLLGTMAAPLQAQTAEAIRCYSDLRPIAAASAGNAPRVLFGPPVARAAIGDAPEPLIRLDGLCFGEALATLLELACVEETRPIVASELFGVWVNRGCPVACLQFSTWWQGRRAVVNQNYGLAMGAAPPAWLDPQQGGRVDPGLFHSVFLPVRKFVEIGVLTTLSDDRSRPMLKKFGHRVASLANMAKLAAKTPHGNHWKKLLETLAKVKDWSDQVDTQEHQLSEVAGFGSNPGELRMMTYLPPRLAAGAPLVVVLHGCTQSAGSYNKGAGWSQLADRHGFALLLPQQQWDNNPLRCFNWFRPEDQERARGEPQSIAQMVERMLSDHALDRNRVFVTGTSSGGAMTAVMLATYPDLFAGGAVIAGVPYRAARGLQEGLECIFQGRQQSGRDWGDLVRAAAPQRDSWPVLSVWHGDADTAVKPVNAEELIKQWTDLHGVELTPAQQMTVAGYPRRVWTDGAGREVIESYTITGMGHGAALDPGDKPHQCGTAAPFFNAVGISSTHRIAEFWGILVEQPARQSASEQTAGPTVASAAGARQGSADEVRKAGSDRASSEERNAAGDARGAEESNTGQRADSGRRALGIDVHAIISASLEAAGLLRGGGARRSGSQAPLGIDVPGIISTAFEAAGTLRGLAQRSFSGDPEAALKSAGWEGAGWQLLVNDPRAFRGGSVLFGEVSSGDAGIIGPRAQSTSRRIRLGEKPELSYVRRLDLHAAVNDYTSASFRVLVDGVIVDEVIAIGMVHQEDEWLRSTAIDLSRFAQRTVTLTLEVAAYSNLFSPVHAKAWVDQISIQNAVDLAPC